jgi:hypothetical protein
MGQPAGSQLFIVMPGCALMHTGCRLTDAWRGGLQLAFTFFNKIGMVTAGCPAF